MPRLIEPGTIVKWKASQLGNRRGAPAILLSMNGTSVYLLDDVGTAKVLRHEIIVPRMPLPAFEPMILRLPYGVWTEEDGSRVLFSREYYPLWRIPTDGHVTPEDPWRWIPYIKKELFWDDCHPPWRNRQTEQEIEWRMAQMGITGTPKLMRAVALLVRGKARQIEDAVQLMVPPGVAASGVFIGGI